MYLLLILIDCDAAQRLAALFINDTDQFRAEQRKLWKHIYNEDDN